jgi:hypothetical protein
MHKCVRGYFWSPVAANHEHGAIIIVSYASKNTVISRTSARSSLEDVGLTWHRPWCRREGGAVIRHRLRKQDSSKKLSVEFKRLLLPSFSSSSIINPRNYYSQVAIDHTALCYYILYHQPSLSRCLALHLHALPSGSKPSSPSMTTSSSCRMVRFDSRPIPTPAVQLIPSSNWQNICSKCLLR